LGAVAGAGILGALLGAARAVSFGPAPPPSIKQEAAEAHRAEIGSGLAAERQVMAATVAPFRGRGEMPRPKVAMRRIKEVLRLKEGLGLSDTAVSRSVRIAGRPPTGYCPAIPSKRRYRIVPGADRDAGRPQATSNRRRGFSASGHQRGILCRSTVSDTALTSRFE
jgi:hypothetical protein